MRKISVLLDTMCRVDGVPQQLLMQAKKDLSVPNPEYVRKKRMGGWTGNLRPSLTLYRKKGEEGAVLPRGYAGVFLGKAKKLGYSWEVTDKRVSFGKQLFVFQGELKPYQHRALHEMTKKHSGILSAPCGAGKTCMGLALAAHWGEPVLVLVHTLDLLKQMECNVQRWLGITPGIIGGGRWEPREDMTLATVQTLMRRPRDVAKIAKRFGTLLLDEAHHVPAKTFTRIIQKFPAKYRYGLSATPEREDGLHPFLYAVMGPLRVSISQNELVSEGNLLQPELCWLRSSFAFPEEGETSYSDLVTALVTSLERNALLLEAASSCIKEKRSLLVLSDRVEHCRLLYEKLFALFPDKVGCITGNTSREERSEVLEKTRKGIYSCLVASRIADEGLDIPCLDTLLFATPFGAKSKGWQRIGRIMRSFHGKGRPRIYDVLDWNVPLFRRQAERRFYGVYKGLVLNPCFPG